jgi:nicotinamide-nucleotide amidase
MTISILTIGDEICLGQIVNTNAAWIADQCSRAGWRTIAHSSVGDSLPLILNEFDRLLTLSDVLIVTGGLGPTHDDRTKTAIAEYTHDTLVLHEPTLAHVRDIMKRRGRTLNELTAAQALQPSRSITLHNAYGTAPGIWCTVTPPTTHARRVLVALPGVPHEMKHLFSEQVLPRLYEYQTQCSQERGTADTIMLYSTLRTAGIAESDLATLLGDIDELTEGQELAFLPSASGVRLRLTVSSTSQEEAHSLLTRLEDKIRTRAGKYILGYDHEPLEVVAARLLTQHSKTVAVAESCTGGLLGATLTNVAGSSAYFLGGVQCYSNAAKIHLVGVQPDTIERCGAVSQETAEELARNIRSLFKADLGISITGIAGPGGGSPEKPVGTVWIGVAGAHTCTARHYLFANERTFNRERSVASALLLLIKLLQEHSI